MLSDIVDGMSDEINRLGCRVSVSESYTLAARLEPVVIPAPTTSFAQLFVPFLKPADISMKYYPVHRFLMETEEIEWSHGLYFTK